MIIAINLSAAFYTMAAAIPGMKTRAGLGAQYGHAPIQTE